MLRRNFKIVAFLDVCRGVIFFDPSKQKKTVQEAGAHGFSIFQGFMTSWAETLTQLSRCKLKQAGIVWYSISN